MIECKHCKAAKGRKHYGTFDKNCLDCCARLVESTRPDIEERDKMLGYVTRGTEGFSKRQILDTLKNHKSKKSIT